MTDSTKLTVFLTHKKNTVAHMKSQHCNSMNKTHKNSSQRKFQYEEREVDPKPYPWLRGCKHLVASVRGKVHFLQCCDLQCIDHTLGQSP